MADVTFDQDKSRYEIRDGGELAGFLDVQRRGDVLVMPHTEIDPAHGGKGLGSALVRGALDDVRRQGLTIDPVCPFVAGFLDKREDYADLRA